MAEVIKPAPFSDPELVGPVLVEGIQIETRDEFMRFTGWILVEPMNPGDEPERRVVARLDAPTVVVRTLIKDAQRLLAKGGH